jgi:hypothetical protein
VLFSLETFKMATEIFFAYYFLKLHLHHFSNIKFIKKSQNSRNQGFSYYFCLMIEGPEPDPDQHLLRMDPDPGGPKTYRSYGSGSGSSTLEKSTYLTSGMVSGFSRTSGFLPFLLSSFFCKCTLRFLKVMSTVCLNDLYFCR